MIWGFGYLGIWLSIDELDSCFFPPFKVIDCNKSVSRSYYVKEIAVNFDYINLGQNFATDLVCLDCGKKNGLAQK